MAGDCVITWPCSRAPLSSVGCFFQCFTLCKGMESGNVECGAWKRVEWNLGTLGVEPGNVAKILTCLVYYYVVAVLLFMLK